MKKFNTLLLMLAVNLGIVLTLSILIELTGLGPYLSQVGGWQGMAIFCLVFGMGGSMISLLLSKTLVKWRMKIQLVDAQHADPVARKVYEMVRRNSERAGLPKTPEVGIYESPELNAFATGASKDSALVAVSTGLLASMTDSEIEGVIGHEVAHIANGDMVRMMLLQGVVNALVMFVARIVGTLVANNVEERNRFWVRFMTIMAVEMVLGLFGMLVVNYYSRVREFRADAGGASYAGRDKMIAALEALRQRSRFEDSSQPQLATMKISGSKSRFAQMFSTHPDLGERIEALKTGRL